MQSLKKLLALLALCCLSLAAQAQQAPREYLLGAGDVIRINVFQNQDLTTEARVSEGGNITLPLVGTFKVGGLTSQGAEQKIAQLLKDGGFILKPQVTVLLLQARGSQVAVLGQVNRPGRYPLETANMRFSDMLATAGGVAQTGSDTVVLTGTREGRYFRQEIDITSLFTTGDGSSDIVLQSGDAIFVPRAPMFYIYGEVQRPGSFRVERNMTVMQALATGGGMTQRGTLRGLQVHRRDASGKQQIIQPKMDDILQPDDVIYVREAIF
ncbi:polysaccharide export protein EpsE [Viridibacterium curvum]|uniref:Polysaccharide biosynthesis/export family protein n=1 Tax=Viridibacterium curvum TaxID=1101404 RepID=A0ABP9R0B8_9RHOO